MKVTTSLLCLVGTLLVTSSHGNHHKKNTELIEQRRFYGDKIENCMQPCGLPLIKLGSYDNEFYFHTSSKMTWMEANKYCEANALNLVSIETKEENDLLMRVTAGSGEVYWTSGNDIESEGNFKWMSTGQNFTFTKWTSWQPKGDTENCVCIGEYGGIKPGWHDAACTRQFYFICERY